VVSDHRAAVPAVELAAVVDAVVEREHLAQAVLDGTVTAVDDGRLCRRRNGHVLLHVVRQIVQLRHATPVRHVGRREDDVDCVTGEHVEEAQRSEYSPLVAARLADVLAQVADGHCSSVTRTVVPHHGGALHRGFSTR